MALILALAVLVADFAHKCAGLEYSGAQQPGVISTLMSQLLYSRRTLNTLAFTLLLVVCSAGGRPALAQRAPLDDAQESIRGTVVNGVTREPIARALVYSSDNRFAALTDGEGHFEFSWERDEADESSPEASGPRNNHYYLRRNFPSLMARKPGFLDNQVNVSQQSGAMGKELILSLTPESLVVGRVLPTAELSERVQLELYRRQVSEGLAHWVHAGSAMSRSNGEFRFAELQAGTYKLLSREAMDNDARTSDPNGPAYGYSPVYFPNATDFAAGQTIQLAAGQAFQADISLRRRVYYPVKVRVVHVPDEGINITVATQGHRGPGYDLDYNNQDHIIEGMLPDGNYTLEASSFGPNAASGLLNISVKGAAVEGPQMNMVPNGNVAVNVKEEFTSSEEANGGAGSISQGRDRPEAGRYLYVTLVLAGDFGRQSRFEEMLFPGTVEGAPAPHPVPPGRYWVRTNCSRGFVAAISSGNTDLKHQPLVVGFGGSAAPIEITVRDAGSEVDGSIEGAAVKKGEGVWDFAITPGLGDTTSARVYFVPLPDSSGEYKEVFVGPEGKFGQQQVAPGVYRVLAFDRPQPELEYRNPEAMRAYDAKGQMVRLVAGQKETLHLQLMVSGDQP